jgi:LDH2 family malate/lactate/ureidoglycolate dehydrogenase
VSEAPTAERISLESLFDFSCRAFLATGVPAESALVIANGLVEAEARGLQSHGVVRLLPVYARRLMQGTTNPDPKIQTVQSLGGSAVIDGDGGCGQVVGMAAMRVAIELAGNYGIGIVGVRHSSHFGIGALYVEQAAQNEMIGIALTNAPSNMPPAGGRSPYFGTNPLSISVPGAGDAPLTLDMSTSVVARGRIVMAEKENRPIPNGWAIDELGHPTVDPAAALRGAVLPMAGYKGAGLALMIDVLSGVLTGAAFGQHIVDLYDEGGGRQNVGHLFLAIDISAFMPINDFRRRVGQFSDEVRSQPRMPGVERIFLPGEMEYESRQSAHRDGVLLTVAGREELDSLADRLQIRRVH